MNSRLLTLSLMCACSVQAAYVYDSTQGSNGSAWITNGSLGPSEGSGIYGGTISGNTNVVT